MPKDDSGPSNHPPSSAVEKEKAPLKRGDACLYCRRRRIRCSARHPTCHNCEKLNRECIYDTGKPVSRVKQLEEKVAELEGKLKTGPDSPPSNRQSLGNAFSDGSGSQPDMNGNGSGNGYLDMPIDVNMLDGYRSSSSGGNAGNNPGNLFPGFGGSMFGGNLPNAQPTTQNNIDPHDNMVSQNPEDLFDFSTLDPNFMNLVNSFQNTSTGVPDPPFTSQPNPAVAGGGMEYDAFVNGGSTGLTPYIDPNMGGPPSVPPPTTSNFASPNSNQYSSSSQPQSTGISPPSANGGVSYQAYVTDITETPAMPEPVDGHVKIIRENIGVHGEHPSPHHSSPHRVGIAGQQNGGPSAGLNGWRKEPVYPGAGMDLVGGWFDAADLPRVARDHLLDLFFSGMRLFGQEFHIPRFFASLSLPPTKRPHPCLLYSMYLMASRISSSQPIRALEPHFYSIAARQLDESISKADRLFDAVRAASILAVYKYSLARYHEGWMMCGQAARLAISCGLHQIPSNLFKPSAVPKDERADLIGLMRHRSFVIPPPKDAIELGERVWAFWSILTVERCGSISSQWPPAMPDDIITTPYPRPLHEYELGLVNEADHNSINTLYDPTPGAPLPHYSESTFYILRMRAICILERASKLMYLNPEPGWQDRLRETMAVSPDSNSGMISSLSPPNWLDEYISPDWAMDAVAEFGAQTSRRGSTTGKGWMRTAKIRTPKAFEEVRQALMRIETDLPPERRTEWGVWDGKIQDWHNAPKKDVFTLHFVLGCAWMFLFDVFSFNAQNTEAVNVARRLVATIRVVVVNDSLTSDLDVFIAMTWSFIVKVLIRENKRLQAIQDPAASAVEADVDLIVHALKHFGSQYNIASMQAIRADRYRKSTMEDMAFMDGDNLDNVHMALRGEMGALGDR